MQTIASDDKRLWTGSPARSELASVLGICAVWAAMWLLMDPNGNFPVNDDWAYAYAARSIVQTGRFALTGFSAPNLILQAYWGALFCVPFGFSFEALRLSTACLGLLGLVAAFLLLREVGADRRTAAVGALTLGANPIYLQLSGSFMTDVPFTALSSLAFWLYVRGAIRGRGRLIAAAYAVALAALFIRQFAMLLPVSFGLAYLAQHGFRLKTVAWVCAPVVLFLGLHLAFQQWVLATGRSPGFTEPIGNLLAFPLATRLPFLRLYGRAIIPYCGLFVAPFFLFVLSTRRAHALDWRRDRVFWAASVVLACLLFGVLVAKRATLPSLGNVILPFGLGPITLEDTYVDGVNIPAIAGAGWFWTPLTLFSAWTTTVLGLLLLRLIPAALRQMRRSFIKAGTAWLQILFGTYIAGYFVLVISLTLLDQIFDRYVVALIIPLCVVLLLGFGPTVARKPRWGWVLPAAGLIACGVLAVLASHDYYAFTRTRWQATDYLAALGVPPSKIDAGFEYSGLKLYRFDYPTTTGIGHWWLQGDEYVISLGPLPGYVETKRFDFTHWLRPAHYSVLILHRLS